MPYRRVTLPHVDAPTVPQFVTVRLVDSLPNQVIAELAQAVVSGSESTQRARGAQHRIEELCDAGLGSCWLGRPDVASIVQRGLEEQLPPGIDLHEWVVMPNHLHFLVTFGESHRIVDVLREFKSRTARDANRAIGRTGPFWMAGFFDRYIRDQRHFDVVRDYIRMNPVKAGLCASPDDWRWRSGGNSGQASRRTFRVQHEEALRPEAG